MQNSDAPPTTTPFQFYPVVVDKGELVCIHDKASIMPSASELVQSSTSVFTLPEIYFRVRDVVDDPNSTMNDLADVLRMDQLSRQAAAASSIVPAMGFRSRSTP